MQGGEHKHIGVWGQREGSLVRRIGACGGHEGGTGLVTLARHLLQGQPTCCQSPVPFLWPGVRGLAVRRMLWQGLAPLGHRALDAHLQLAGVLLVLREAAGGEGGATLGGCFPTLVPAPSSPSRGTPMEQTAETCLWLRAGGPQAHQRPQGSRRPSSGAPPPRAGGGVAGSSALRSCGGWEQSLSSSRCAGTCVCVRAHQPPPG